MQSAAFYFTFCSRNSINEFWTSRWIVKVEEEEKMNRKRRGEEEERQKKRRKAQQQRRRCFTEHRGEQAPSPPPCSHEAPSPSVVWEPHRGNFWELCNAGSGGPAQIYSIQNLGQPLPAENPDTSPGGLSKAALSCHRGGLWKVPQARAHHALRHSGA